MNQVADGGGGGGAGSFDVDRAAVIKVNTELVDASEALDDHASATPGAPDAGDASALLGDIIATFTHVAGGLSQEAGMLGDIGTAMLANYGDVDEAVADVMRALAGGEPR